MGYEKFLQRRAQLERRKSSLQRVDQDLEQVKRKITGVQLELKKAHEERLEARKELARVLEDMNVDVRLEIIAFGDRGDFETRREQWFSRAGLQERDCKVLCNYVFTADGEVPTQLREFLKAMRTDNNISSHYEKAVEASDSKVALLVGQDSLTKHFLST